MGNDPMAHQREMWRLQRIVAGRTRNQPQAHGGEPNEQVFHDRLARLTACGWKITWQDGHRAQLEPARRGPNHVMHFVLGWVTCFLWWIVWAALASAARGHETNLMLTVSDEGTVYWNGVFEPAGTFPPPLY